MTAATRAPIAPAATLAGPAGFRPLIEALWRREAIVSSQCDARARALELLLAAHGPEGEPAHRFLADTGIRGAWNAQLGAPRAAALAAWLAPVLRPPVLDVLAGDGQVARALVHREGVAPLVACERTAHYPAVDFRAMGVPFVPFDGPASLADVPARTALYCAVLHHEADPVALLDGAAADVERLVVVENCVEPEVDHDLHRYVDVFFNRCLNRFGADCPPSHRTAAEWRALLTERGTVTAEERRATVPGIPFSYHLFVVDR